jgi:hypothetical protein
MLLTCSEFLLVVWALPVRSRVRAWILAGMAGRFHALFTS